MKTTGCLIVLLYSLTSNTAFGQGPTADLLLESILPASGDVLDSAIHHSTCGGDTANRITVSASVRDVDLYHDKLTDSSGATMTESDAYAPSYRVNAVIGRKGWGLVPSWDKNSQNGTWYGRDEGYRVEGQGGLHTASLAGWIDYSGFVHIGGEAGWSINQIGNGHPSEKTLWFDSPRFQYGLFAAARLPYVNAVLYGKAVPVQSVMVKVVSLSNNGYAQFPAVLTKKEIGVDVCGAIAGARISGHASVFKLVSDTGASSVTAGLKTVCPLRGIALSISGEIPAAPLSPCVSIRGIIADSGTITGVDGETRYFSLATQRPFLIEGNAGCALPWNLQAEIFGEYAQVDRCDGFIDFFPFSSWTIFQPKHDKITGFEATWKEIGGDIARQFIFRKIHSLTAMACVSNVRAVSYLDYKELQYTLGIPVEYGPQQTLDILDGNYLMFKLLLRYTLTLGRFSLAPRVEQLLPVDVSHTAGRGSGGAPSKNRRTLYGGTLYELTANYGF
jgi:hypothetical protein